ncbi:MAG: UDP-glucose/GDP-mannose dehydrogenase family protein [Alphaproteobacteria bacterium]|nr:UDP-glucose/GDP-mannose dehydrogenase family protein [Alphaproteobacteria bacterium]
MKLTIFGSGYVGLVTGACLADIGHNVMCVDRDEGKIAALKRGEVPIYEPGLDEKIESNAKAGRLHFTTDAKQGVEHGKVIFIAVGTPPDEDGSADISAVLAVAKTIATHMTDHKTIVTKSTVPVGSADQVRDVAAATLRAANKALTFDVASNPEFLKEGNAIEDFEKPDRIVVGVSNHETAEVLREIYAPFNRRSNRMVEMDVRSAELTKYAANAMLATKISFMNELSNLADALGADIEQVRMGIGSDARIGYHFIYPGAGYGGSCFPKDVKALAAMGRKNGVPAKLVEAVEDVNERQKRVLVQKIEKHFGANNIKGKTFALWGLAFKPSTDDMREAPSRAIMENLWEKGAKVKAYDPKAMEECHRIYGTRSDLTLCDKATDCLDGADALIVVTEWKEFQAIDADELKARMKTPVIFDGRNIYDPKRKKAQGIAYYGIGRNG